MVPWIVKNVYGVEMVFTVKDILLKSVSHVETARQKDEYYRKLVLAVEIASVEERLYHRKSFLLHVTNAVSNIICCIGKMISSFSNSVKFTE
jgi:hypothetical protein